VLTGFNTDIGHSGTTYHVQTEDRGRNNPLIESLVYVGGEILASRRTAYGNLVREGADRKAIQSLMESQHRTIVDAIRVGRLDLLTQPPVSGEGDETSISRRAAGGRPGQLPGPVPPHKTLDEVIAEWLAEQHDEERLRMSVAGGDELACGRPFALQVSVRTLPADVPVVGARVAARLVSGSGQPVTLVNGSSDAGGAIELRGKIPDCEGERVALLVSVQHGGGTDEVKFLIQG
jgi:hypothetical protein